MVHCDQVCVCVCVCAAGGANQRVPGGRAAAVPQGPGETSPQNCPLRHDEHHTTMISGMIKVLGHWFTIVTWRSIAEDCLPFHIGRRLTMMVQTMESENSCQTEKLYKERTAQDCCL